MRCPPDTSAGPSPRRGPPRALPSRFAAGGAGCPLPRRQAAGLWSRVGVSPTRRFGCRGRHRPAHRAPPPRHRSAPPRREPGHHVGRHRTHPRPVSWLRRTRVAPAEPLVVNGDPSGLSDQGTAPDVVPRKAAERAAYWNVPGRFANAARHPAWESSRPQGWGRGGHPEGYCGTALTQQPVARWAFGTGRTPPPGEDRGAHQPIDPRKTPR